MEQPRIAKFEKISERQFQEDFQTINPDLSEQRIKEIYENIMLPVRGTSASAAYDFAIPYDVIIKSKKSIRILTGIRCRMDESYCLYIIPRSSMGIKMHLQLDNTVGLIDADYYQTDNEGHIQLFFHNDSDNPIYLEAGIRIAQGSFLPYGITVDDNVSEKRTGGFGSTGK